MKSQHMKIQKAYSPSTIANQTIWRCYIWRTPNHRYFQYQSYGLCMGPITNGTCEWCGAKYAGSK